jgi:hypothetical protein
MKRSREIGALGRYDDNHGRLHVHSRTAYKAYNIGVDKIDDTQEIRHGMRSLHPIGRNQRERLSPTGVCLYLHGSLHASK